MNRKMRNFLCILLILTLALSAMALPASATAKENPYVSVAIDQTKAIQNGVRTTIDEQGSKPFKINGRTMIPVRFIGEKWAVK